MINLVGDLEYNDQEDWWEYRGYVIDYVKQKEVMMARKEHLSSFDDNLEQATNNNFRDKEEAAKEVASDIDSELKDENSTEDL